MFNLCSHSSYNIDDPEATKCSFLRYSLSQKGYKFYCLVVKKFYNSMGVTLWQNRLTTHKQIFRGRLRFRNTSFGNQNSYLNLKHSILSSNTRAYNCFFKSESHHSNSQHHFNSSHHRVRVEYFFSSSSPQP